MNNWGSWLNCPFQVSLASSLIHFASLPLVFLPHWSPSSPYRAISSLLTYSSCTFFSLSSDLPHPSFPSPISLSFLLLSSLALLMWILFCDGLFRREWVACMAGQPASAHRPSARNAVVLEFCWELSCCLCLFLSGFTLLAHTHTPSLVSLYLHHYASLSLSLWSPSLLLSTVHLNSNTQLISILKSTSGFLLWVNQWLY